MPLTGHLYTNKILLSAVVYILKTGIGKKKIVTKSIPISIVGFVKITFQNFCFFTNLYLFFYKLIKL